MASRDIFLLEFAIFIENPYLILIYLLESDLKLAVLYPKYSRDAVSPPVLLCVSFGRKIGLVVFYNTMYTGNTVVLHVICHLSEKVPLGMLCGIVKSRFTTDADGETNKRPLIHSKVKTVGCVSPRTCKCPSKHIQNFGHICCKKNWKVQISEKQLFGQSWPLKEGTKLVCRKKLFAREYCICNEGNPPFARESKGNPPNRSNMTLLSDDTKAELNHCFIIPLTSIDDKFIFDSACLSANLGDKGLFRCANILWIADIIRRVVFLLFLLFFQGSKFFSALAKFCQ